MPDESQASGTRPTAHEASASRAAGDVVLQVLARVLNALLGVAVTIVLARGLGTRGFGDWSTLLAIVTIVGYLGTLGLQQVAVRQAAMDPDRQSVWVSAVLSLQLIISVPVTLIALAVGVVLARNGSAKVAAVLLSITCLLSAIGAVRAVFQLRIRNSWTAGFELLNGLLWAAAVFSIAAAGAGIIAYAAAFTAVTAVVNVVQLIVARRELPFGLRAGRVAQRELMMIGLPFAIATLLYLGYTQIDQVLVFQYAGERAAGLYGAANRVFTRGLVVPTSILATLFPMIAAAYGSDIARMRALVQTASEVLLTVTLPAVCLVVVVARPVMRLMFGAQFAPAGPALAILMVQFAITSFSFVAGDLVMVLRLQRRYVIYATAGLIFNVALNVLLIPRYGFLAAAWVSVATEALVIGLALRATLTTIEQRLRLGRMLRIAITSAAGAGAALLAREAGLPLLVIGAAWLLATLVGWVVVRPWSLAELQLLWRRRGEG